VCLRNLQPCWAIRSTTTPTSRSGGCARAHSGPRRERGTAARQRAHPRRMAFIAPLPQSTAQRTRPPLALDALENQVLLDTINSERFADTAPGRYTPRCSTRAATWVRCAPCTGCWRPLPGLLRLVQHRASALGHRIHDTAQRSLRARPGVAPPPSGSTRHSIPGVPQKGLEGVALNLRVCPQQYGSPRRHRRPLPEHTTARHSKFMKPGDAKSSTRSAASAWECTPVPCDGPGTGDGSDTAIQQRGSGDGAWLHRSISRGPSGLPDPGRIAQPCLGHADLVPDGSRTIRSGKSGSCHRTTPLASCGRRMNLPRSSWHTSLRAPGVRPPPRSHSPSASPLCAPRSSRTPAAAGARRS